MRSPRLHPAAALGLVALALPAIAAPGKKVACTLPTIEAIVREVGGDGVDAFSLAAGDQDPHTVSPTPALMKRVREADLLVEIGMQLETWADLVADGSGNPRIFRGAPGRVALASGVPRLEVPAILSRSQGDIHPEGNPHLWLDPVRAKLLADNVALALKAFAPDRAGEFEARAEDFKGRVDRALFGEELLGIVGSRKLGRLALDGRLHEFLEANPYQGRPLAERAGGWLRAARTLRGRKAIEFHRVWVYFAQTFGITLVGTIEERPGIAPGPKYVAQMIERGRQQGVSLVLVDNFYDPSLPEHMANEIGARMVMVPNQVRGEKGVDTYFALFDHLVLAMTAAPKGAAAP